MEGSDDMYKIKLVAEGKGSVFEGVVPHYRLDTMAEEEKLVEQILKRKKNRTPEETKQLDCLTPRVNAAAAELEQKQTSAALTALITGVEVLIIGDEANRKLGQI
jgi:hypothetical protein